MTAETPVTAALTAAGIPHRLFLHDGPVRSAEQAVAERGMRLHQLVKTIVVRLAEDSFILVLIPADREIDWRKLRAFVGARRMRMATPEEALQVTGYPRGAIAPLGLPSPLPVYADESIREESEITMGAGILSAGVILPGEPLLALVDARMGDITSLTGT